MVVAQVVDGGLHPSTLELLGKGRELAQKLDTHLSAALIGPESGDIPQQLGRYGAERVYCVEGEEFRGFVGNLYGEALAAICREARPEVVLAAATDQNRAFLPYAATLLETGLTANCMALEVDVEKRLLLPTRPAYSGNLMATIVCPERRPQMATVKPYSFPMPEPVDGGEAEVIRVGFEPSREWGVEVLESRGREQEGPDIRKADFIVGVGRGVAQEKMVEQARELADLLGGAVGGTRPVCDMGLLPEGAQIGQTGVSISPKLYLALGISGAAPHTVGIQGYEALVAVNKDREAPIFSMATHACVADAKELMPRLLHEVRRIKKR